MRQVSFMGSFKTISIEELSFNPFTRIGYDWMLLTAGNERKFNTMTASWGGVGVLWNRNVVFTFVRPQRYTLEFLESEPLFTCSFFPSGFRRELSYCGAYSGRDVDKMKETGLTPYFTEGTVALEQAELVLVCRKLAVQPIDPAGFFDGSIESNYNGGDYHKIFIGEIVRVLIKE